MNTELLVKVLNAVNDRVFLKEESGRITFVNQAFLRTYGLTENEVLGKCHKDFLPSEMIAPCAAADAKVLKDGQAVCLETRWENKHTGVTHWSETHKTPLIDEAGRVYGIAGISRDVTVRRNAEEELKRQKNLLELIIEAVPDNIFVKDAQRRILLANQAFLELISGYTDQALDSEPSNQFPRALADLSQQTDALVLKEGKSLLREITFIDHDGTEKCFEIRKMPLLEEGTIAGIVGLCRDLTETKTADRNSKYNEALLLHSARLSSLGELATGIAHEVNQPLYSILNYAKAIENKLKDEAFPGHEVINQWIEQIKREATRGGKITQRLRSFIKPTETQRKKSEINKLVRESVGFVAMEAHDQRVAIEYSLAENLPLVDVDRVQMQQVIVNLLKNALEAHAENGTPSPRILISTQMLENQVEISVADNGPGISSSAPMNILDPFQTTKEKGIGLGLAISNTIIETHKGRLSFQNNEWGGTTFCVLLPISNEN